MLCATVVHNDMHEQEYAAYAYVWAILKFLCWLDLDFFCVCLI